MKTLIRHLLPAILLVASPALAADWHWELPPERYKVMNTFERAQYDKAAKLLQDNQPAAAATEFEKFKVQFGDSPNLSYSLFMRGYCLEQAKKRNLAIKAYQEVVDYFADQAEDASAALYFEGVCYIDNGETAKGLACMKQMVESPIYQKRAIAAGALRRLADSYWDQNQPDQAVKYWRQTVKDFNHINDQEYSAALTNLVYWYVINRDYAPYEDLVLEDDAAKQDPQRHRNAADFLWNRGLNIYRQAFERKKPISEKDLAAEQKAFYEYLKTTKPWWIKANDQYGYYDRVLTVLVREHKDKAERDAVLNEALAFSREEKDKASADGHISHFCDVFREGRLSESARLCVSAMTDRLAASWKEHEILCDENKWKEAMAALEPLEASPDVQWQNRAMGERARIYKDALGQYDKAIALYERMNQPPGTLWQIQDAYKRWNKLDEALKTLTEIENLFPDDAPRAIWQKASYYHEAGDKKRAMAQAHHLLKAYPKAAECSPAHTMLAAYGEPNFGGQTDDQ